MLQIALFIEEGPPGEPARIGAVVADSNDSRPTPQLSYLLSDGSVYQNVTAPQFLFKVNITGLKPSFRASQRLMPAYGAAAAKQQRCRGRPEVLYQDLEWSQLVWVSWFLLDGIVD